MVDPSEYFRVASHPSSSYPPGTASESGWVKKDSAWSSNGQVVDEEMVESFIDDELLGWEAEGWRTGGWAEEGKYLGEISADAKHIKLNMNNGDVVFIPHRGGELFVKDFYDSPEDVEILVRPIGNKMFMSVNGLGELDVTGLGSLEGWDWLTKPLKAVVNLGKKAVEVAGKVVGGVFKKGTPPAPPAAQAYPEAYPGATPYPGVPGYAPQYAGATPALYEPKRRMNPWLIGGISVGGLAILGTVIFLVSRK